MRKSIWYLAYQLVLQIIIDKSLTIDIWLLKLKSSCSQETDAAKGLTAFHMAKFEIKLLRIAPADLVSLPLWVKKAVFDFASHKDTVGICKNIRMSTSHWFHQYVILTPFWTHTCKISQHMEEGVPHQLPHHLRWHQTNQWEEPT